MQKRRFFSIVVFLYVVCALLFVSDGRTLIYHSVDALFLMCVVINILMYGKNILSSFAENFYAKSIVVFSIYVILSFLWSPNQGELSKNILLQGSLILNSFALFYIVNKYKLVKSVLLAYVIYTLINHLILFGVISNDFFSSMPPYRNGRFVGTTINPNSLSIDLVFSTFCTLLLIKNTKNKTAIFLYGMNIFLIFNSILLAGSKKGLISFLVLMCFYVYKTYLINKSKRFKFIVLGSMSLLFISVVFQDTIIEHASIVIERFSGLSSVATTGTGDESTEQRALFISLGIAAFLKEPILGYGQDSFAYFHVFYSHNNYIEILHNLGIIGFILYYSMFVRAFKRTGKSFSSYKSFVYILLLIILFMDVALVSYNLRSHMLILTLISLLIVKPKISQLKAKLQPLYK